MYSVFLFVFSFIHMSTVLINAKKAYDMFDYILSYRKIMYTYFNIHEYKIREFLNESPYIIGMLYGLMAGMSALLGFIIYYIIYTQNLLIIFTLTSVYSLLLILCLYYWYIFYNLFKDAKSEIDRYINDSTKLEMN